MKDTIFALSTAPGISALAVLRISGPNAFSILKKIIVGDFPAPRVATFKKLIWDGEIIDECIVICFNRGSSFTGEQVVELQTHGSPAVIKKISNIFLEKEFVNLRPAEEGEFTRQAFYNGKMDLSQTEAIADLIHAQSESSHKMAMNQMKGGFTKELNQLRASLIEFASLVELELDFSEEDVEFADRTQLKSLIDKLSIHLNDLIKSFKYGNAIKNGVQTALIGMPNAGKSTLLNGLLNENRAIVSDIPGTTRDTIEETLTIDGILYRFVDTAGIRNAILLKKWGLRKPMKK